MVGRFGPRVMAAGARVAWALTLLNRRTGGRAAKLTNLVVYRTTDGGRSWQTYPVGL